MNYFLYLFIFNKTHQFLKKKELYNFFTTYISCNIFKLYANLKGVFQKKSQEVFYYYSKKKKKEYYHIVQEFSQRKIGLATF